MDGDISSKKKSSKNVSFLGTLGVKCSLTRDTFWGKLAYEDPKGGPSGTEALHSA